MGAAHSAQAITWKNEVVVTLKNAETWEAFLLWQIYSLSFEYSGFVQLMFPN